MDNKGKGEESMFGRLFGETEVEQMIYLRKRVYVTAIALIAYIISGIFSLFDLNAITEFFAAIAMVAFIIALYLWGFGTIKTLLGYGTIGAFFSGNVIFGSVIFVICLFAAYLIGGVIAFLGVGRYIYLRVKLPQVGV